MPRLAQIAWMSNHGRGERRMEKKSSLPLFVHLRTVIEFKSTRRGVERYYPASIHNSRSSFSRSNEVMLRRE